MTMAYFRKQKSSILLRLLVVPTLFLCAIFKTPVFQWIAVAALAVWLYAVLSGVVATAIQKRKRKVKREELTQLSAAITQEESSNESIQTNDLFLIRQVNFRITEQLKGTYPMVSWLWVKRPSVEELCEGGTWRIRIANADPFNFGDVELSRSGKLTITMLQAMSLRESTVEQRAVSSDLEEDEILDRVDVKSWYLAEGEQILSRMIDDLNTQGHRKLMIREDGEVVIRASGADQTVDTIKNFPPRLAWDEFCNVLREDEITATIQPDGLVLSW